MESKEYEQNKGRWAKDPEAAKEAGAKGGKASGIARRKKRKIQEAATAMLEANVSEKSKERISELLPDLDIDDLTASDLVAYGLISSAISGNSKAVLALTEIQNETENKKDNKKTARKKNDFLKATINDPQYETLCDIDKKAVETIARQADTLTAMIKREQDEIVKEELIENYNNGGGQTGKKQNPRIKNILELQAALSSAIADIRVLLGVVEQLENASESEGEKREEIINALKENRNYRSSEAKSTEQ